MGAAVQAVASHVQHVPQVRATLVVIQEVRDHVRFVLLLLENILTPMITLRVTIVLEKVKAVH